MAILYWTGDSSTHFNDDDNWSDPTLSTPANAVAPVAGDSIIFDDKSDGQSNLILVQAHITEQLSSNNLHDITITKAFTKQIQTNGNATLNLDGFLSIDMPGCIKAASNGTLTFDFNGAPSIVTYDGGGSAYAHKALVNYGPSLTSAGPTPFVDDDSRTYTTYNFGTQTFSMIDGIYPNITFTGSLYAKSVYSDASRKVFNAYGSVDILNFNGGNVLSSAFDIYDYDKQFYFEKDLTGIGEYFKFGHTTARFKTYRQIGTGAVVFPATGELKSQAFGNDTTGNFYTQYHKIVIENNDNANNYWLVNAGRFIECNELVINDGGRFYGPSSGTKAVTIRSVKRPTVQGDWNFRQIADGIYESVGDSTNIPVTHGGTGRQTLTKDYMLYGDGMNQVGLRSLGTSDHLNLSLPFMYQRDSLGANAYDLRLVSAAASTSTVNGYPMAATGKVIAVSFHSAGTSIGADANNQTFEVRTNGGSGTNIQFSRNDMTNTNGSNYTYTETGLSIAFSANDVLQIRRTAGSLVYGHMTAIIYIRYD